MKFEQLSYASGEETFAGRLFLPKVRARRPGILVCHDGAGPGAHAWERARRLAGLGYVAYAPDFLGGPYPDRPTHIAAIQNLVREPSRLRERAGAALAALRTHPRTDAARTAAIGFCFGGTVALELARGGADIGCAVSFHGGLSSPKPAKGGDIRAALLVCAGASDPFIGPDTRATFQAEMDAANADWQMIVYAGAKHGFTNPQVDSTNNPGSAYHRRADERSWAAMRHSLSEAFDELTS